MSATDQFRRFLHAAAREIESDIDRLVRLLPSSGDGRVRMLAYAGYRNADEIRVMGRIVRFADALDPDDSLLSRVRAMLAIYNSHELSGVAVRLDHDGRSADTLSDEEGYFSFALPAGRPLPPITVWDSVTLSTPARTMQAATVEVPVLAPGTDDHWGVISDIDDTVIETGATNFLRNWRRVLVDQPRDRLAVPGAASLYGMIARDHRLPTRPFFYVSSSPWNLYGFLAEFMELNAIPHGVMFLKDIGIEETKFMKTGHAEHKLAAIRTIIDFYPDRRFLLMGDNGQKDVEIYAEAVHAHPGRIGAVLIRDVSGSCQAGANSDHLAAIAAAGVPTYCAESFAEAHSVLEKLGFERPTETAKAGAAPADGAKGALTP
ncbi:MAG: phosphatase domain-containing protein [Rhizorhabdus sp.]